MSNSETEFRSTALRQNQNYLDKITQKIINIIPYVLQSE